MKRIARRQFLQGAASAFAATHGTGIVFPGGASGQTPDASGAIDAHAHMPLRAFGNPLAARFGQVPEPGAPGAKQAAALAEAVGADSFDAIAAFRIEEMDRWGVSRTAVMPIDFAYGRDTDRQWEEAEATAEICRKHSGRFIAFLAIDPRRGAVALDRLERAVGELGVKGVKLHPLAGFKADDRDVCYPFYKKCSELGTPVLGHCRPLGRGDGDDNYSPQRYARVAADFPDLKICLGHAGGPPWRDEVLEIISRHPNAYGDLSSHQTLFDEDRQAFDAYLRKIMDSPGRERMMYGTDWPNQRELGKAFTAAFQPGGASGLTADESRLLLSENAKRFLNPAA